MELKKHITDEKTGIGYTFYGDFYLPDFSLGDKPKEEPIGIWGQRHREYLKMNQKHVYDDFLFSGKLNAYLTQIDTDAQEMFTNLVMEM